MFNNKRIRALEEKVESMKKRQDAFQHQMTKLKEKNLKLRELISGIESHMDKKHNRLREELKLAAEATTHPNTDKQGGDNE